MESKSVLQSTTVRAILSSVVGLLVIVATWFGYAVDIDTQEAILVALAGVWTLGSSIWAIYGRIKATKQVHITEPK
jgi:hypothetical protein